MMKDNKFILSIFLVLLLSIGIGYAYLTSNLSITGSTKINANTWDIHFNNVQVDSGSVPIGTGFQGATIDPNDNTKITFSVNFDKPGDYYRFTADIVNAGTIDGMISSIEYKVNNQDISNLPNYMEYSITYLDGDSLGNNFLLEAGHSETIIVGVRFKDDISEDDLLDVAETLNFSLQVNYTQARSNAINRLDTYYIYTVGSYGIYSSPEEAMNSAGQPAFGRMLVRNSGGGVRADVGFMMNDTLYYISGGGGIHDELNNTWDYTNVPYESNKNIAISAFGSSNCNETINSSNGVSTFLCFSSLYSLSVKSDGNVYVRYSSWHCAANMYGGAYCYFQNS